MIIRRILISLIMLICILPVVNAYTLTGLSVSTGTANSLKLSWSPGYSLTLSTDIALKKDGKPYLFIDFAQIESDGYITFIAKFELDKKSIALEKETMKNSILSKIMVRGKSAADDKKIKNSISEKQKTDTKENTESSITVLISSSTKKETDERTNTIDLTTPAAENEMKVTNNTEALVRNDKQASDNVELQQFSENSQPSAVNVPEKIQQLKPDVSQDMPVKEAVPVSVSVPEQECAPTQAATETDKYSGSAPATNEKFQETKTVKPAVSSETEKVKNIKNEAVMASASLKVKNQSEKPAVIQKERASDEYQVKQRNKVNKTHIVEDGETLPMLAKAYYQDQSRWVDIYEANKDKIEKGFLRKGQILIIP